MSINTNNLKEKFVSIEGQDMYRISNIQDMAPFLMSVTSPDNHWMYVSSTGGLTAGRVNVQSPLFPYETEDKLHRSFSNTGPVTLLKVSKNGKLPDYWEPFTPECRKGIIKRNLYKDAIGNRIIFEEFQNNLGLSFRYSWSTSEEFGFIRTAVLINHKNESFDIELLDGIRNILPAGIEKNTQLSMSSLVDAYKYSEIDTDTGLGIYSLAALMMDRPDPGESLKASVVWQCGLNPVKIILDERKVEDFREGKDLENQSVLTGQRGAYLINCSFSLSPGQEQCWNIVADVDQSQREVTKIRKYLANNKTMCAKLENGILASRNKLSEYLAKADGFQITNNLISDQHHTANVLYNIMRGGLFADNYRIDIKDFLDLIAIHNQAVYQEHYSGIKTLGDTCNFSSLRKFIESTGDKDLLRFYYEYLPLMFSRRHGDPSRPWNQFDIHIRDKNGSQILNFQGNWRDIFQNWEALSLSYPEYLESLFTKFVNASTVDGFNPYRITRDGIDWDVIDPADSWVYIGYWGDHQIIYLLKLLETSKAFHPARIVKLLHESIYCYANVPYRLKPFNQKIENPKNTIDFDFDRDASIGDQVTRIGADARLLLTKKDQVYHVNLIEKLLVPMLSKLSNLIPGAGIWMNTQRPEWNDANNALAGYGLSMVTLYYLRRYIIFFGSVLEISDRNQVELSTEVVQWFQTINTILIEYKESLTQVAHDPQQQWQVMKKLGTAFSDYHDEVYQNGFSNKSKLPLNDLLDFCQTSKNVLDFIIRSNQRDDGLFHSYNLLDLDHSEKTVKIKRLHQMLEGQIAVISSGLLEPNEVIALLKKLFRSPMFREDQNSFMLYPSRQLPGFLQKNIIPKDEVCANALLMELIERENTSIIEFDADGHYRFNSSIRNASDLETALEKLSDNKDQIHELNSNNTRDILDIYESVFNHLAFTGRSGTMYAYEGIGSIYWHMVAKLLLAVQEIFQKAVSAGIDENTISELGHYYYKIRSGLGIHKTAEEYGAFPFDPYSHSPANSGARQPGMTGQVKEEIITRFGELGVIVNNGQISFQPVLLRRCEFLSESRSWRFLDLSNREVVIELKPNSLAFTFCQVPVVYNLVDRKSHIIINTEENEIQFVDLVLNQAISNSIFKKTGGISLINVYFTETNLIFG